ncbi:bacteriocin-associated integral membrane family protein [Clostridium taeniosporum]|nr:DUF1430 domain-containing protein [Clostridium taeniosporum]
MKKVICLLFTFQLIVISICGLDIFKDKEMNNILFQNKTSILLNFDSPREHSNKFGKYIQDLGKKKHVSISKYVFKDKNNIVIYTSDPSLNEKVSLTKGRFPNENSNEFISNTYTEDLNQSGTFQRIDPKTKIIIKNIDINNNFSGDGIYYISTTNEEILNDIVSDLNENVASAKIFDSITSSNIKIDLEVLGTMALVSLCVLVAIVQYSVDQLKEVSILCINGFSITKILSSMSKKLIKVMILGTVIAYIMCSIYYISINNFNYFGLLSIYFGALAILYILISICILFFVIIIHLKKSNKLSVIKGKRAYGIVNFMHYSLKIIFVLFLLFSINQLVIKSNILNQQLEGLSNWEKAQNLYTTVVTYTGENEMKKHFEVSKKMKEFYKKMSDSKDAFIIRASNYNKEDESYNYELDSEGKSPETSPYGKCITIDENYLKYNYIESVDSSIVNQINHNDNVLNILVPEKLQIYEQEIRKNYLDYFYFQKVKVENIYNEELNLDLNKTIESNLKVNIIYVKNNQNYFSYKSSIEPEQKNLVNDPIAVIYTDNVDSSYCFSYMTNSFYFYSDTEDPFGEIFPIIAKYDLQSSFQKVVSVYDKHGKEIQELQKEQRNLITFIVILFISNLIITYNLIAGYYEKNKYKLYIKKLFGYSNFRKNRIFILLLFLINIIPVVIMTMMYGSKIILTGIVLILIEFLVASIIDRLLAAKSFNSIIKGEH